MCEVQVSTEHGEDEVPNCSATERSQSPVTNCSILSNPSSMEDETNHSDQTDNRSDDYPSYNKDSTYQPSSRNLSNNVINCSNLDGVGLPTDTDSLSDKQGVVKLNLSTNNVSPLSLSKTTFATNSFHFLQESLEDDSLSEDDFKVYPELLDDFELQPSKR